MKLPAWLYVLVALTVATVAAVALWPGPGGGAARPAAPRTADPGTVSRGVPPSSRVAGTADQATSSRPAAAPTRTVAGSPAPTTRSSPGGAATTVVSPTVPEPTVTTTMSSPAAGPASNAPQGGDAAPSSVSVPFGGAVDLLTVAPEPPRLRPVPADFATPVAVAAAWMAAWCYRPLDMPVNQNIGNASWWVTKTGFATDRQHADTQEEWDRQVASGLTPICGPVSAVESTAMPRHGNVAWVLLTARRAYVAADGTIVGQESVSRTRRVLQHEDGRWFVDIEVSAG